MNVGTKQNSPHKQEGAGLLSKPDAAVKAEEEEDYSSESEDEAAADGDLSAVKAGMLEPCKLVRQLHCKFVECGRQVF